MNAEYLELAGYFLLAFAGGWASGFTIYAFRRFSDHL